MLRQILQLLLEPLLLPATDSRMSELRKRAVRAFGDEPTLQITAFRSDHWAWLSVDPEQGLVRLEVRGVPCATAALAAALAVIAEDRAARAEAEMQL